MPANEKLTTSQAAAYIGVTKGTLEVWRCNRVRWQPPYYKIGRKVVYSKILLDEYLAHSMAGEIFRSERSLRSGP